MYTTLHYRVVRDAKRVGFAGRYSKKSEWLVGRTSLRCHRVYQFQPLKELISQVGTAPPMLDTHLLNLRASSATPSPVCLLTPISQFTTPPTAPIPRYVRFRFLLSNYDGRSTRAGSCSGKQRTPSKAWPEAEQPFVLTQRRRSRVTEVYRGNRYSELAWLTGECSS